MNHNLSITLISRFSFEQTNHLVVGLIRRILSVLETRDEKYLECHAVSFTDAQFARQGIKYNDASMDHIIEHTQSGEISLYGIADWDIIRKGQLFKQAYVNIRVRCNPQYTNNSEIGSSVHMVFNAEVAEILFENDIGSIIGEMAKAVSADYGWIDGYGFTLFSPFSVLFCLADPKEYPCEYDMTGRVPCISWWTMLSREHLSILGGKEAVIREAPCFAVHDLSEDGYEALALQPTEKPEEMRDSDYLRLREYLKPLIPPVNRYMLAKELKKIQKDKQKIRDGYLEQIQLNATEEELAEAEKLTELSFPELNEKAKEISRA